MSGAQSCRLKVCRTALRFHIWSFIAPLLQWQKRTLNFSTHQHILNILIVLLDVMTVFHLSCMKACPVYVLVIWWQHAAHRTTLILVTANKIATITRYRQQLPIVPGWYVSCPRRHRHRRHFPHSISIDCRFWVQQLVFCAECARENSWKFISINHCQFIFCRNWSARSMAKEKWKMSSRERKLLL